VSGAQFDCAACEKQEARGGDPRGELSGSPKSCDGPREWKLHGGRVVWSQGCPWRARDPRASQWISWFNATEGKLSYAERVRTPGLLLDAFAAIEEALADRRAHEDEIAKLQAKGR
jgi:hypothetical protein